MSRLLISFGSALLLSAALTVSAFAADDGDTQVNSQQASNWASSTQAVAAFSGDASARNRASATSGDVWVYTQSVIAQKNVQIAANIHDIEVELDD